MQNTIWIVVWAVVIGGTFAWLWRAGHLARFRDYVRATREELRKCSWPTWDELKGSTMLVTLSIAILGGFTIVIDQILFKVFMFFKL